MSLSVPGGDSSTTINAANSACADSTCTCGACICPDGIHFGITGIDVNNRSSPWILYTIARDWIFYTRRSSCNSVCCFTGAITSTSISSETPYSSTGWNLQTQGIY
jgi:hypothetical protein